MNWPEAVRAALRRLCARHGNPDFSRQQLLQEELDRIVADAGSLGATPEQTLSRVLQELRDNGLVAFLGNGNYLLLEPTVLSGQIDVSDEALETLVDHNLLRLGNVETGETAATATIRRGQQKVREFTLKLYAEQCSLCDVREGKLLIASHISPWAKDDSGRGDLTNVICMCRMHDALFEYGYFSLADDYKVLKRVSYASRTVSQLLEETVALRLPGRFQPSATYLDKHRGLWRF